MNPQDCATSSGSLADPRSNEKQNPRSNGGSFSAARAVLYLALALACSAMLWNSLRSLDEPSNAPLVDEASAFHHGQFPLEDLGLLVADYSGQDAEVRLRLTPPDGARLTQARSMTLGFTLLDVRLEPGADPALLLSGKTIDGVAVTERRLVRDIFESAPASHEGSGAEGGSAGDPSNSEGRKVVCAHFGRDAGRSTVLGLFMVAGIDIAKGIVQAPQAIARVRVGLRDLKQELEAADGLAADSSVPIRPELTAELTEDLEARERTDKALRSLTPGNARRALTALGVGIELAQGHPQNHTTLARVDSVREILIYRVAGSREDGRLPVEASSRMELLGSALVAKGARLFLEVGQFVDVSEYDIELSVNGRTAFEPEVEVHPESALPPELSAELGLQSKVAIVEVKLPDDTQDFRLTISHRENRATGLLHTWYFGVEDFGLQESLRGGYETIVLWNRALDLGSIESFTSCGRLDLTRYDGPALAESGFEPGDLEGLHGFRAKVDPDCGYGMVLYSIAPSAKTVQDAR